MKRIKVITPIITPGLRDESEFKALEHERLRVDGCLLEEGPSSIESVYEEMLAAPGIAVQALRAQAQRYDAVIVDCFADPGVQAARELLDIPVFGPGETSMHAAAMMGPRFSIITVLPRVIHMLQELAHRCGLGDKLASVRSIDIPVLSLHNDMSQLQKSMGEQACQAVREDGADVIVLGCTGFLGCAQNVKAELQRAGLNVPVIDPIPLTVNVAAALCESGISHSKRAWPLPDAKTVAGFAALQAARG